MKIPFQDLTRLHNSIRDELDEAITRVVDSSAFIGGNEVLEFENAFAGAHGAVSAAGCGSGTDALALTLRALGIGPGDEVIVPSMTFIATAEAVVHVGATPVIADVDPVTLLLTDDGVARVRTDLTRAVIPVHLYGHIVPFTTLRSWRDSGILVVEDAAQAHLGQDGGQFVGAVGNAACFSFYPGKNLGAFGDGGAVISNDSSLIEEVRRLRDHGRESKYSHDVVGWCSRLDGLQAAVLAVKLRHLPEWTERRRDLARRYNGGVGDLLVPWSEGAVHHLLVARVANDAAARDLVRSGLNEAGIAAGIHYPIPLSQQPSMKSFLSECPAAETAATQILTLPMDPLMSLNEVDAVIERLTPLATGWVLR